MTPSAGWATPLVHVAEVERSIRFYKLLGFQLVDTEGEPGQLGWARMHCEGGALMFLRSEHEGENLAAGLFLYLYSPDLPALRVHLVNHNVAVSPLKYPDYQRSGVVNLRDPDGCYLEIAHWGRVEQERWEKKLREHPPTLPGDEGSSPSC